MSGQCRVIDELVRKHQRIISHRKLALLCRHFAAQHNRLIMTTWFIGRHPGALQWIREQGIAFDRHASHLNITQIQPGDTIIGTLPVTLIAQICARSGAYWHLSFAMPEKSRGSELSAADLRALGEIGRAHV